MVVKQTNWWQQIPYTERAFWIHLWATKGIGLRSWMAMGQWCCERARPLSYFLQKKSSKQLRDSPLRSSQIEAYQAYFDMVSPAKLLQALHTRGVLTCWIGDEWYPSLLREIEDPPGVLFIKARTESYARQVLDAQPKVALVGTRKMTVYGADCARELGTRFARSGAIVVSGLMYGVDIESQRAALAARGGSIGVVGYGFEHWFPGWLEGQIATFIDQGLVVVTEYPPWIAPRSGQFVQRNRIVAGLSHATIVVEAGKNSGSLITAGMALDQNRIVGAVPAPLRHPYQVGTKALLNQGAILVTEPEDIWHELEDGILPTLVSSRTDDPSPRQSPRHFASDSHEQVFSLIRQQPASAEKLAVELSLKPSKVAAILGELSSQGLVVAQGQLWMHSYGV